MASIEGRRDSALSALKAQTEEEFLVKIGAKEEEFEWDPKIVNEPLRRPTSFMCIEYHRQACYRPKPKILTVNAWRCSSEACRQLTLVSRYGPRNLFINNRNIHKIGDGYLKGPSTLALGLCYNPRTVSSL